MSAGRPTPPAFFDDGYDGSWVETLSFLPWTFAITDGFANAAFLNGRDDAGGDHTDRLAPAPVSLSLHSSPSSGKGQHDHA